MCSSTVRPGTTVGDRILGHADRAGRQRVARVAGASGVPAIVHRAGVGVAQPEATLVELALAVAGHAGDADQLAGGDVEVDVVEQRLTAPVRGAHVAPESAVPAVARRRRRALGRQRRTVRPTIASTSSSSVSVGRVDAVERRACRRAARSTRSAMARVSRSLWVMIDDRQALGPQRVAGPAKSASTSWGASTLVGSSRITSWAPSSAP